MQAVKVVISQSEVSYHPCWLVRIRTGKEIIAIWADNIDYSNEGYRLYYQGWVIGYISDDTDIDWDEKWEVRQ